jgi:L-threonylcarbamoyladenylate synthase
LIIDGGQSAVGIESTVVDLSEGEARVLRPGMIHEESLAAVLERPVAGQSKDSTLRSPGLLPRHYSPRARVVVLAWESNEELLERASGAGIDRSRAVVITHGSPPATEGWAGVNVIPHDAEAYARALYAEWHRCDEAGIDAVVMEAVPDAPEWRGIADRLRRAAAD